MQFFMGCHPGDIVTVQQPIHLFARYGHQLVGSFGPLEFFFGQTFIIKHEAITLPKKTFDLVALAIGKRIKITVKGVVI
jgi:hypothetical protein